MGGNIVNKDVNKVDSLRTDGLSGQANSLAYRVHEIEKHFHGRECWRGKKAAQTATDWADDTLSPFRAISGADDWGGDADDEAQVFGTDDTPFIAGNPKFDIHRILIVATSVDTHWKLRFVWGTGTMAAAIAANQFSCFMLKFDSANPQQSAGIPVDVMMPRLNSGVDKVWLQAWNATDNATIDFLVGTHEYEG
jgi:hypothetical protein